MFEKIIKSAVFSICFIVSLSLLMYLDLVYAQEEEWSDSEGWIVMSPFLLINCLYGFLTDKFKDIILYSSIGTFLLTLIFYIAAFFDPPQQQIEPDIMYLAYNSPIPYILAVLGISFIASFIPLVIGWILGTVKRKILS